MACDVVAQIHEEYGHDPQRIKHPSAAISILVLIIVVIGLRNNRDSQETDYRERKRLPFPGDVIELELLGDVNLAKSRATGMKKKENGSTTK